MRMHGEARRMLPTTTVAPARLRLCQPTQRPTYRTGEWVTNSWGQCRVIGRFGQRHQDLLDVFLWTMEASRETDDGAIELLVDPATVRRVMSDSVYSMDGLKKLIQELRAVTLELKTSKLEIVGGLLDHVTWSAATKRNPLVAVGGVRDLSWCDPATCDPARHLWRVRLGMGLAELLRHDLPLHYDPTSIIRLQNGISQAVARHVMSHASQPHGGWKVDGLIEAVAGELTADALRNRRREIRIDAPALSEIGIILDEDRVFFRKNACSTRPIKAKKTQGRVAPARCRVADAR